MSSIALALTRDFLLRSRWPTAACVLYLVGLPWAGYGLLLWHGLPLPEESAAPLSFGFVVVALFSAMFVVFCGQGENRFGVATKLYVMPAPTWLLVGCRMLQGAVGAAVFYCFLAGAYRVLFGLQWPWAGPALAMAVAMMWIQAFAWSLLHFRFWRLVALIGVIGSLGYWIAGNFQLEALPAGAQGWTTFTAGDFLVLSGFALAAFGVGVLAVAQHRRGDCESAVAWLARMERYWDAAFVHREQRFHSPEEALFWMEWSRRGIALPATMACLLTVVPLAGAVGVALGWTRPIDVLEVVMALPLAVYPQLAFVIGMFIGHRNTNSSRMDYDSFSATRPVNDATLATAFLRSTRLAVISSYSVSLVICLATAGWTGWHEGADALLTLKRHLPWADSPLGWWAILPVAAASLLATWFSLGLGASIVLAGNTRLTGWSIGLSIGGLVLWIIVLKSFVPANLQSLFAAAGAGLFGMACLLGTLWAFIRALQKHLTRPRTALLSALAWIALCGLVAVMLAIAPPSSHAPTALERWLALPWLPGLLAAVFAPLATAPLALAWNRHR